MAIKEQVVEIEEGVRAVVSRLTYGMRYEYGRLANLFMSDSGEERPDHILRSNFVYMVGHTRRLEFDDTSAAFTLPSSSDSLEEIEEKFRKVLDFDAEGVERWMRAVANLQPKLQEGNDNPNVSSANGKSSNE